MSAPSPETSMQTPQREFALQRYTKYLTYANKNEKIEKKSRALAYVKNLLYLCTRNWGMRPYGPNETIK